MTRAVRALIVVAVVGGTVWAQGGAGLSGSWTLDRMTSQPPEAPPPGRSPDHPAPPPPPPPPQQTALRITQSPGSFRIERTLSSSANSVVQDATYMLDGSQTTSRMGPIVSKTIASWDGRELLLSTVQTAAGDTGPMAGQTLGNLEERFRLEDGRLVIESRRQLPGGQSSGTMIYIRAH